MSPIAITLILLLVAVALFATEKLPVDVVGLLLVIGLVMTGVLTVQEGVSGFGDNIIITIGGLFVLTGGLVKTGLVDLIGRRLYRISGDNEFVLTALIMVVAALCASVMKNTTTTAMFVPVVMGLAHRAKIAPSKLLMPLAFGAILGGSCTLIGTSTNLAVSGAIQRYGMQPYSMFELTSVGVITVAVGLIYMLFVGIKLLPNRGGEDSLTEQYSIREYVSEVLVLPESHLVGKKLSEANINLELDLSVLGIIRGEEQRIAPQANERIQSGDLLIVEGKIANILNVKAEIGLQIKADFKLSDVDLQSDDIELFEVMVMRDSRLVGQNLRTLNFRHIYDLTVLAINRHGEKFLEKMSGVSLRFGDVLLVQGNRRLIEPFVVDREMMLLDDVSASAARTEKRKWAIAAFGLFLALSLSKLVLPFEVPLTIAVLLGVLVLLAIKNRQVRRTLFVDRFSFTRFDRVYDELRRGDGKNRCGCLSCRIDSAIFRSIMARPLFSPDFLF